MSELDDAIARLEQAVARLEAASGQKGAPPRMNGCRKSRRGSPPGSTRALAKLGRLLDGED